MGGGAELLVEYVGKFRVEVPQHELVENVYLLPSPKLNPRSLLSLQANAAVTLDATGAMSWVGRVF